MIFIPDIIEWIIDNIDYNIKVSRVVDNGDNTYTLYSCDTAHLRPGKYVTIAGNQYKITEFSINNYIIVSGSVAIDSNLLSFEAYKLGYQSGTLRDADKERGAKVRLNKQESPFIWNREPYQMDENWDDEDPIQSSPNLTWYLLDECNTKDWLVKDHHNEVINPMHNLFSNRIKKLINGSWNYFQEIEDLTITGRVYLGTQDSRGNFERLFEENLSGIEINLTLPILQQPCCTKVEEITT